MVKITLDSGHVVIADCDKSYIDSKFKTEGVVFITVYGKLDKEDDNYMRRISFNKSRIVIIE